MEKILIVNWRIKDSEADRILKLLPELIAESRKEPGNVSYAIYQSENDPHHLILHEEYTDADALETHKHSEHYQRIVLRGVLPHLASREVTPVTPLH